MHHAPTTAMEETHMADKSLDPTPEHTGDEPGTPRWVKVFGIIAIFVVLLIGFILFSGLGGPHGPQRHGASGGAGGDAPRSIASTI
jgi:hypothetical protein